MRPRIWQLGFVMTAIWCILFAHASESGQYHAADALPADIAVAWFDLVYDVVRAENVAPPQAARIYGLTAVTLYEAIVPGSSTHRSLVGQLNELTTLPQPKPLRPYHWPAVANSALASLTRALLLAASQASIEAVTTLEQAFAATFQGQLPPLTYRRSVAHGQAVAEAIVAWAATDGIAYLEHCPYTPPVGPGLWEPTPPAFVTEPLQPCWGQLRPMVLPSAEECAPPPPPAYSEEPTSGLYAQAFTVYQTGQSLTSEQQTIAHYWADNPGATGTPPGHWIAIMGQLARHDELSLMVTAEGFARVGIAVTDAFIGCWHAKDEYVLLRPVTFIQQHIDPAWLPLIGTPNFPEYTSGHSAQSAAVAALTAMFGIRSFTDTLHLDHSLALPLEPRTFSSFDAAAEEAAISRIYGGIHYPIGSANGLVQGRCIGQVIIDRVTFKH
jgi:hypothetical protein